jgi:hypothetical protein
MNLRLDVRNVRDTGVGMRANYTWSHAIDNLSSTFSELPNNLNLGLLDPFDKRLDRGDADFDMRHRVVLSGIWEVPFARHTQGWMRSALHGWTVASIFTAHSGTPYSLFDCSNAFAVYPRAAFDGPVPQDAPDSPAAAGGPNRFNILNLQQFKPNSTFVNPIVNISDFGPFPRNMTGRNVFRAPHSWNMNLAVYKTTKLTERFNLQLRGEAYNLSNHSNLIVTGTDNDVSSIGFVSAARGVLANGLGERRNVQVAAKIVF